jgi:hypothetical protein
MFNQGYVKIRDIVFNTMAKMGEVTTHKFPDLLVYALDGYWEYQQDYKQEFRTVEIELNRSRTFKYPKDWVTFSRIGFQDGDRIETALPDQTLALKGKNKYDAADPYTKEILNPLYGYYNEQGLPRELYAWTFRDFNKQGFYVLDHHCREIRFTEHMTNRKVYIEYVSNELNPNSHTVISQDAYQVISSYIWKEVARYDKRMGERSSEYQLRLQSYLNEISLMRGRRSDLSIDGLVYLVRKNTQAGIR